MKLITPAIRRKLEANGREETPSGEPVVKIFNPFGEGTWWICFIKDGVAYGFADCGFGVEFGPIDIDELSGLKFEVSIAGRTAEMGLERDVNWNPKTGWDVATCKPIL